MKKLALSVALALSALTLSSVAWAVRDFPHLMYQHLGVDASCPTHCSYCHASDAGGGPASQPFAIALKKNGLNGLDETTLVPSLDKLAASGGSDAAYLDVLKACKNPNASSTVAGLGYGCAASPSSAPTSPLGALAAVAVAVGLGLSRRRAR
jgi:MYXO-CTERM domain-containing protein